MSIQAVLLPVFVQVFLTWIVGFTLAARRTAAFKSGTKYRDIALREPNWPQPALQAQYAFGNQFELPVLFYVVMILAIITRHADLVLVILAWVFVAMRIAQAYVHVTSNYVPYRGLFFGIGALALFVMWVWFAIRILAGLP
ncbi:MAG: MAPEG family protein [Rhizobiales bacterium]|nr:MAPEG family protein [Hyphomicrobiales bacterium]OJY46046.1 MAG: hypothetical protein BGP08_06810 [Rhizobiales bacterium 64-17]